MIIPMWVHIILILLIMAMLMFVFKDDTNIDKKQKSKPESSGKKSGEMFSLDNMAPFIPLIILVIIVVLGLFWWSVRKSDHNTESTNASLSQDRPALIMPPTTTESKGLITWSKTAAASHIGNHGLQSFQTEVVVNRNDSEYMSLTATFFYGGKTQTTHYRWNKREKYGKWHQESPRGGGLWYLHPYNGDNQVFVGEVSDESGVFIPLRLELI